MLTAKLTPWFKSDAKPVRIGYYLRNYRKALGPFPHGSTPDYWDGEQWVTVSIYGAHMSPSSLPLEWRGLASNPAEAKC